MSEPTMTEENKEPDFKERMANALFGLGYLAGAVDGKPEPELLAQSKQAIAWMLEYAEGMQGELEEDDQLRSKLADILTRTANVLKGEPGPLHSHSWHDLPESAALAMHPDMKAIRHAAAPFDLWWAMVQAQEELGGQPIPDSATIFHFMGSGASTMVTAKQLRDMMAAIYGPALSNPEPENHDAA